MQVAAPFRRTEDGHLWMIAAVLSLFINVAILTFGGLAVLEFKKSSGSTVTAPPSQEPSTATIYREAPAEPSAPAATAASPQVEKRFAHTAPEQAAPPAEAPAFIGERNTRATSESPPIADAPPLPSQAGVPPRDETDVETTESDYRDGSLLAEAPAAPESEVSENSAPSPQQSPSAAVTSSPPPREALLEGPHPVDVQVPKETAPSNEIKPTPERPLAGDARPAQEALPPAVKPSRDPAFSGFRRKTAIVGSISRTGRSSLDVEDSPLGRYQATISRAVELEWQRNCVRHRDFITPGYLTVRFFVETSGRVRSVQFVGDMETGEIQKGFTLNSIRDAEIPAMPAALRREYDKEPLELIFRFYF